MLMLYDKPICDMISMNVNFWKDEEDDTTLVMERNNAEESPIQV